MERVLSIQHRLAKTTQNHHLPHYIASIACPLTIPLQGLIKVLLCLSSFNHNHSLNLVLMHPQRNPCIAFVTIHIAKLSITTFNKHRLQQIYNDTGKLGNSYKPIHIDDRYSKKWLTLAFQHRVPHFSVSVVIKQTKALKTSVHIILPCLFPKMHDQVLTLSPYLYLASNQFHTHNMGSLSFHDVHASMMH